MDKILLACIGLLTGVGVIMFVFALMKVSSKCSREEEQRERDGLNYDNWEDDDDETL